MNIMTNIMTEFDRGLAFRVCETAFNGVDSAVGLGWKIGRGTSHLAEAGWDLAVATGYFSATVVVEGVRLPGTLRRAVEEHEWWAWWGLVEVALGLAPPIPDFFGAGGKY